MVWRRCKAASMNAWKWEDVMKRPGTLKARITVPAERYVPGAGTFTGTKQYQDREVVINQLPCDLTQFNIYATLVYDLVVQFDEETIRELPGLFCLLNGLPKTDEVEIPDFSYMSRDFYVIDRKIVLTGVLGSSNAILDQLGYVFEVFSDLKLRIATRRDTRAFFTKKDVEVLHQYIADKSKHLLPALRQLLAKLQLFVDGVLN